MKLRILAFSVLAVALAFPGKATAKLRVVATFPELVDITKRIGGEQVAVDGLARGPEDPHQIVMKPSFVPKLNRADAVVFIGMTLEHSFLPGLLDVAVNNRMRADPVRMCTGPGCIDCSEGLNVLERPATLSRAEGELHPDGNPHYNIGPENGALIAKNIAAGLSRIDAAHAADYQKNLTAYLAELDAKLAEWRKWAAPLKGVKAVSYHRDTAYIAKFTGIAIVETIEPKPGVPPTPSHVQELARLMKEQGVTLIIHEQQFDRRFSTWLAQLTGAKVAVIGVMGNALPRADTFIKMSEQNLKAILQAAGKSPS